MKAKKNSSLKPSTNGAVKDKEVALMYTVLKILKDFRVEEAVLGMGGDVSVFQEMVGENILKTKPVVQMPLSKLAEIITLALAERNVSQWRSTSVGSLFPEGKHNFEWSGKFPLYILQRMAMSVIVAAMYDVLMTERLIRLHIQGGNSMSDYRVPSSLISFVGKERIGLNSEDLVKHCSARYYNIHATPR